MNGDNNKYCYKCNTFLASVSKQKTYCPKCNQVYYDEMIEVCPSCGGHLQEYNDERFADTSGYGNHSGIWMYVLAVLIPIVGFVLGFIYLARRDDDIGKRLLITSVASLFIWAFVWLMLVF